MRILMMTVAAVTLAACTSPTEKAEAAPATAAATQAEQTAEAFVRSLYGSDDLPTGDRSAEDLPDNYENTLFSARTRALIEETERLNPEGYVGFFEAHPFCDCQDGTPVLDSATAVSTGPDSADVAVIQSFAEPGNAVHRKTYRLVREGGAWKIDDMTYQDMGQFTQEPLVQRLNTWIAEAKADPNASNGE